MAKTQIYMNEDNIDWTARFADAEEKSIFTILKESKLERHSLSMLDNALQKVEFSDYLVSDMSEMFITVILDIGGMIEKRRFDFLKTTTGWGVIREFRGHTHPITISINELDTNSSGYLSLDLQGTGLGNDTVNITLTANSKTSN